MARINKKRTAALAFANSVRKVLGFPPVDHLYKGQRRNAYACPITNTVLGDDVSRKDFGVCTTIYNCAVYKIGRPEYITRVLPGDVAEFISTFDRGYFRDLVE